MPGRTETTQERLATDAPVEVVAVLENGGLISDSSEAEVEFIGEWRVESNTSGCILVDSETSDLHRSVQRRERRSPLASSSRRRRPAAHATALRTFSDERPTRALRPNQRPRHSIYERIHRRLRELTGNRRESLAGRRSDSNDLASGPASLFETLEPLLAAEGWPLGTFTSLPLASDVARSPTEARWAMESSPSRVEANRRYPSRRPARRPRRASSQPNWAVAMLNSFLQPSFDSMPSPSPNPCPRALVELLPIQTATVREASENCPICLSSYHQGERLRRLPCLHLFHRACIDRWLSKQDTCPVDKMKIADGFTDAGAQTKLQTLGIGHEGASHSATPGQQDATSESPLVDTVVSGRTEHDRRQHRPRRPGQRTRQRVAPVTEE
jgi:hypothetical protein